ncbi:TetR/AcrR family transcriptional regulator [Pelagicoccus sp. SDUM812002]|uniref:TetR/AcrR family transcriptional regulator n=1 Tax=Pelagicoccus sp. SDUM812002 TaxID=3041266 RepID=UPI00280FCEE3|nr:TetR/AcrR family transcriptional regulator [Pelagicoccus sp. SDUM812002]MDQ8185827.1 TetR/AcrR family transcriptional regulator [Pelagicoccus sp. SDUM812002]
MKHCREETLERATELFWERGYRGVSIKDLTEATGVLAGSLYASYGNKDGLFMECVHRYGQSMASLHTKAEEADTYLGQISSYFEILAEGLSNDESRRGCFLMNAQMEIAPDRPEIAKALSHYTAYIEGWFESRLDEAKSTGELNTKADVTSLAEHLMGVVYALWTKARAEDRLERLAGFSRGMVNAILSAARVQTDKSDTGLDP